VQSLAVRLAAIRVKKDQNRKNLRVAEIVSELFRAAGTDPIIVSPEYCVGAELRRLTEEIERER